MHREARGDEHDERDADDGQSPRRVASLRRHRPWLAQTEASQAGPGGRGGIRLQVRSGRIVIRQRRSATRHHPRRTTRAARPHPDAATPRAPCRLGDGTRAPGDVGEQMRMGPLHAHQVIAAILRRAKHDAFARRQQRTRGPHEQRRRQGGTVGIHQADRAKPDPASPVPRAAGSGQSPAHPRGIGGEPSASTKPRAIGEMAVEPASLPAGA